MAGAAQAASQVPLQHAAPVAVPSLHVVRLCALQWQATKRTGAADGVLWRDFAARCYQQAASKGLPQPKPGRK